MGCVPGFLDQASWRRGRRPAVPRPVAANPARQPLPPRACAEQSVRGRWTRSGAPFVSRRMDAVARRGSRGGAARDARGARARIHVVHLGRRRAVCARSGRARARDTHLGGRPSPPRAYHGAERDRRSAAIQLPRRSRHEETFFSARAAAESPSDRRGGRAAVSPRRASEPCESSAVARTQRAIVALPSRRRAFLFPVPLPAREGVRG